MMNINFAEWGEGLVVGDYEWGGFVDDSIFLALNQVLPKKELFKRGR
jgi:hypothetical protein